VRSVRIALLIVVIVVLQTTLFSRLRIAGVAPELGLLIAVAIAYREGPVVGAVVGFVTGLAMDCFLATPFGLSALAFALTGYTVGVAQGGILRSSHLAAPLVGGLGSLAGGLIFAGLAVLAGQEQLVEWRTLLVVVIAASFNALLSYAVFPVAQWAARPPAPAGRHWAR